MKTKSLKFLEKQLDVAFDQRDLFVRALTHTSYLNENPEEVKKDNERLEFLGDAVLDFVVAHYLYRTMPETPEGELTAFRAALVRREMLADFARTLDLGSYLLLGVGESENGGRLREPTLCAAFEAVIGALYLDQPLPKVITIIENFIEPALIQIIEDSAHIDAKSELQVVVQARWNITPHYKLKSSNGPDHARTFTMAVYVGDEVWGEGVGRSKQLAAQAAARATLNRIKQEMS